MAAPTRRERLGATAAMRDSTKASMRVFASDSCSTCSHEPTTRRSSSSGSTVPTVVDAVTVTTMIVADGSSPVKSTSDISISLPSLSTTRA